MIGIAAVIVAAWSATRPASPLPCPYSTCEGAEPPTIQVSFDPPPWLEFTTSWPSGRATRVRPPGSTQTSSPSFTAKGRRSA